MNLQWSDDELQFRRDVQSFLQNALPPEIKRKVLAYEKIEKEEYIRWQRILNERGWLAWSWPREYGGPGWSPIQTYIFEEECWLAGAPEVFAFGVKMLAPVLMKYGSEAQKSFFLPRILNSDDWWCQGYSEPGSGSDLASLKTKARVEGDFLIVNGQKTWTTNAHYANKMFCLVRTDAEARPQEGISFILIDMDLPGVTVRPIKLLDGTCEVNEVFFDDVRVPRDRVIGELNKGWDYAKALLGHERLNSGKLGRTKCGLRLLKRIAQRQPQIGQPLIKDLRFAARVAQLEVDILALEYMTLQLIANAAQGRGIGPEASILKLRGTEIAQQLTRLLMDAMGSDLYAPSQHDNLPGAPLPQALVEQYFNWRKLTIYGGSNEIQRNIIAKQSLGL